ncbi:hypothetical protein HF265_18030 [Rhizobium leguminosarum]|uniref:hypothetical protein n=1 Tax=Rhizobium leguminosarum TaxID=384 RepID=UPI001C90B8C9|nr:hypothetical protein [Rhizobium leguminosarum]MBY3030976.1 hypothetical protein [Rhizobium leguminosarum]
MNIRKTPKTIAVILALLAAGASHAAEVTAKDIPGETKQEIKDRCTAQWKDHQDRYGMIAYCIKQEVQAWAVIENFK